MKKFKSCLLCFRPCRPKTKSLSTTHFFSPFNPKALEIAYPSTPSPPPTTPIHAQYVSKSPIYVSTSKTAPITTTPEFQNSPISFDDIKSLGDPNTMKSKENNKISSFDESCWFNNSQEEITKSTKKMNDVKEKRKSTMMKESSTVVKWSEQPYDDFKRSMLEMILEKEMFRAKDLEKLLQCFLTLNSKHHHADIIAAFTEIWKLLFK